MWEGSYLEAKWPRPRRVLVISRGLTRIYEENVNSSVAVHRLILLRRERRRSERRRRRKNREKIRQGSLGARVFNVRLTGGGEGKNTGRGMLVGRKRTRNGTLIVP